jgi:hypothetical protein
LLARWLIDFRGNGTTRDFVVHEIPESNRGALATIRQREVNKGKMKIVEHKSWQSCAFETDFDWVKERY